MKPKELITAINGNLKAFIGDSFYLIKHNEFHYKMIGESLALNRFKNEQEQVRVLKWFDKYWLFLEIRFKKIEKEENKKVYKKKELPFNTCISLSVFQGEENDKNKYQLLRAEWDDYNSPNEKHAQPHWHITSNQAIESTVYEFGDIFEESYIIRELERQKHEVFDVKKIHFAMNGDWQYNGIHTHRIEDEYQVVKWLQGMLSYLREELENE